MEQLFDKTFRAIFRAARESWRASAFDAGFDAGEFSGPAHMKMLLQRGGEILKENGATFKDLERALFQSDEDEVRQLLKSCEQDWNTAFPDFPFTPDEELDETRDVWQPQATANEDALDVLYFTFSTSADE